MDLGFIRPAADRTMQPDHVPTAEPGLRGCGSHFARGRISGTAARTDRRSHTHTSARGRGRIGRAHGSSLTQRCPPCSDVQYRPHGRPVGSPGPCRTRRALTGNPRAAHPSRAPHCVPPTCPGAPAAGPATGSIASHQSAARPPARRFMASRERAQQHRQPARRWPLRLQPVAPPEPRSLPRPRPQRAMTGS